MKKIFTFLLAIGSFTIVVAQSGRDYKDDRQNRNDGNGYAYNDRHDNSISYSRERAFQIEKINREYDYKVSSVIRSRHMRSSEKSRILRNLDIERNVRIRDINNRYDHYRFDDNHYDRGNNNHH